ncbi:hypothetical protein FHS47_002225 [Lutibacter sp. SG786]|nr:hypothetical protein [Luteibacter sp. SG786]
MVIDAFDTASLAVMMRHRLDTLGQRHVSTPYVEPEEDVISYRVVVGAPGSIGIPYFQAHELDADLGEVSVRKVDGQLSLVCQPWGGLRWIGDLQDISKAALNFSTHHPEWVAAPFTFYQISTGNNLWGTTSGLFAFAEIHDKVDLTLSWRLVTHLYDGGRQPVEEIMPSGKEGSVVMRSTRFDPGQFSDSLALEGGYAGDEQVYVFRYYDGKKIACPLSTTTRFRIENQSFDFSEHGDKTGSYFALDNTLVKFKELSASFNTDDIASKTLSFALSIDFVEVRWPVTVTPLLAGALPPAMAILRDANGAQYLATEHARVRLNTLFARQLVEIAQRGIHAILSPQTQRIPEPLLGKGRYVRVVLPPPVLLGTHEVELQLKDPVSGRSQLWWRGLNVEGRQQSFDLLVPFSRLADGELVDFPQQASLVVEYRDQAYTDIGRFEFQGTSGACRYVAQAYDPVTHPRIEVLSTLSTPMDFGGANALYFWELFYYTPMMAMQRLLQERRFDEAGDWLKYVWDPSPGAERNWITRPLLEDTSWNADPLDSVDPDAVAQSDPMHYKVATFFRALDLLIARGDAAYRQLQRDTLNEAKGWYLAALKLLGTRRSFRLDEHWENPTLGEAAAPQRRQSHQRRLLQLQRAHRAQPTDREANGTALTELFLPESNDVLLGYWQTIEQRLYNLRHHLSIDGQPLSLPIYAKAADPKQLLTAAVAADEGGSNLPSVELPPQRFALLLESARTLVFQLIQFGSTMQSLLERQDGEALGVLLQTQAEELVLASIRQQQKSIEELEREEESLQHTQQTVRNREARYVQLIEEDVNSGERKAMNLRRESGHLSVAVQALYLTGASVDMAPNIFGVAAGGMRWGGFPYALGNFMGLLSQIKTVEADKITQTEVYRRRRQEWEIQRDAAQGELKALEAQLKVLAIRKEAAALQKAYLQTQQAHAQAQLQFLRRKFTNEQLYSWLRGRLATIFYQFYDVAVGRCLMAERSYQWETQDLQHFVKAGAWQGNYAGLLCGEALMLNLAQMDKAYLEWDRRALEVRRTLSLTQLYAELDQPFSLATEIRRLLESGSGQVGDDRNGLSLESDGRLILRVDLTATNLGADYPVNLGPVRRIKQISVSLPAILGAYQDVQAVLSYAGGGNEVPPRGCEAIAISHGVNDNGLFQLDFNEGKYLPFEGVPISARLALSFPHAMGKQKNLLNSLNDVILHVAYTIRQR